MAITKRIVRSGIRTHAYMSRLRPERSALDRSAILTAWKYAVFVTSSESIDFLTYSHIYQPAHNQTLLHITHVFQISHARKFIYLFSYYSHAHFILQYSIHPYPTLHVRGPGLRAQRARETAAPAAQGPLSALPQRQPGQQAVEEEGKVSPEHSDTHFVCYSIKLPNRVPRALLYSFMCYPVHYCTVSCVILCITVQFHVLSCALLYSFMCYPVHYCTVSCVIPCITVQFHVLSRALLYSFMCYPVHYCIVLCVIPCITVQFHVLSCCTAQ